MRTLFLWALALFHTSAFAGASFVCFADSFEESEYLSQSWEQVQSRWLFSQPGYQNLEALKGSLEHIESLGDSGIILSFTAQDFFQHCWADQVALATDLQPRFLIIALDHTDNLYHSDEILDLWQQSPDSQALRISFPLWDLRDQPFFNSREIRGRLSHNYQQFLERYDAAALIILRGQLNEDYWDLRITSPTGGDQAYLSGCSMSDVVQFLRQKVLAQYQLSQVTGSMIVSFNRDQQHQIRALQESAEVLSLQPRIITKETMEFRLWSYWTTEHHHLIEKEFGLKIHPDRH